MAIEVDDDVMMTIRPVWRCDVCRVSILGRRATVSAWPNGNNQFVPNLQDISTSDIPTGWELNGKWSLKCSRCKS